MPIGAVIHSTGIVRAGLGDVLLVAVTTELTMAKLVECTDTFICRHGHFVLFLKFSFLLI